MKRLSHPFGKETSRSECPRIRLGLQPFRYQDKNKQDYIGLKDPLELSDAHLLLPHDLYYLLQFFDGAHSIDDIISEYMRQFRNFLPATRLIKLIKKMDEGLLLDNVRSQKRIQQIEAAFRKRDVREPACAGNSYAASQLTLESELNAYRRKGAVENKMITKFADRQLKAMIVPHIDPRLGGAAYGAAYHVLQHAHPVDQFIILGVSHQTTKNNFVMTEKDFSTPLGLVKTNRTFVTHVLERCTTDFARDEIVHRDEHSIEFQTLFLKHTVKSDFLIVPILCSFSHCLSTAEKDQFKEFVSAMRAELDSYGGSVCIIASVDFSHIGLQYGDESSPNSFVLTKVENSDKMILDALARQDLEDFEYRFARTNNRYNICGYPALRTLFELLTPAEATLLTYDNAIMDEHRSTVTFASMVFS